MLVTRWVWRTSLAGPALAPVALTDSSAVLNVPVTPCCHQYAVADEPPGDGQRNRVMRMGVAPVVWTGRQTASRAADCRQHGKNPRLSILSVTEHHPANRHLRLYNPWFYA